MRALVFSDTSGSPRTTRETVFVDTPARRAMSASETFLATGRDVDMGRCTGCDDGGAVLLGEGADGFKLREEGAEGRGLDGSAHDGHAGDLSGQVAQEAVARASTHEVELVGACPVASVSSPIARA